MTRASSRLRAVQVAATALLVVGGVGSAGAAGLAASLVCWKESSSYCGAAQLGWTLLATAALLAVLVGVAWLWGLRSVRSRVIGSATVGLVGLAGVVVVVDGSGREQPTVVGVVDVVESEQVCWRPVELAPMTDTLRPVPDRLEGAPRCTPRHVVRDDELGSDETVYVDFLRARHTQRWLVTSVHVRNTVVAVIEAVDPEQVCWKPVELAPQTDKPRPLPSRLEGAARCAPLEVVRDEGLVQGQTVHVNLLRDLRTGRWRATSVRARDSRADPGSAEETGESTVPRSLRSSRHCGLDRFGTP